MHPATVRVDVWIDQAPENRLLSVAVDNGEFYRSSDTQLDGETSPRHFTFLFPDLPEGEYLVRAALVRMAPLTTIYNTQHFLVN